MSTLRNKFRSYDLMGPTIQTELHFDEEVEQKTYFGSFITIIVQLLFFSFIVRNFLEMIHRDGTYLMRLDKVYSIDSESG